MARFPLTLPAVRKVWDGSQNPLGLLNPNEATAAELYVQAEQGEVRFGPLFKQHFGFEITTGIKQSLRKNPAWKAYVTMLRTRSKAVVLAQLEAGGLDALKDYRKAREMAMEAGDYKEVRVGAADHLDRIGATRRQAPAGPSGNVIIVLKTDSPTHAHVLKQLPVVEAELVEEDA